jgi:hypothetical protein
VKAIRKNCEFAGALDGFESIRDNAVALAKQMIARSMLLGTITWFVDMIRAPLELFNAGFADVGAAGSE